MQNYCSEHKNEELLTLGLAWLEDIGKNVFPEVYAPNPHMLIRVLEDFNILYCDRLVIESCLARKAGSKSLGFVRQDYPDLDPPDWHKFITIRQKEGSIQTGELPIGFWGPLSDNYEKHNKEYVKNGVKGHGSRRRNSKS
jgi:succinate dehydrogenase/fumarate reductase flavoprotein subunit